MKDKLNLHEFTDVSDELLKKTDLSAYDEKTKEAMLDDIMMEFGKKPFSHGDENAKSHTAEKISPPSFPETPPSPPPDIPVFQADKTPKPTIQASPSEKKPLSSPPIQEKPLSDMDTSSAAYSRAYYSKVKASENNKSKDILYNTWSKEFDKTNDNVRLSFKTDTIVFSDSTEERDIWGRVIDRSNPQKLPGEETHEIYGGAIRGSLKAEVSRQESDDQSPDDVRRFLFGQKRGLFAKTVLAFIIFAASVLLSLIDFLPFSLPASLSDTNGFTYALSHLILSLIAFMLYARYIGHALLAFMRLRFYNDTLPIFALFACIIYNFSITSGIYTSGENTVFFTMIPVAVIAFSLLGKLVFVKNVIQNFELAVSDGVKHAGTIIKTSDMPVRFFGGDRKACSVRVVDSIVGFFEKSFSDDPSEKAAQITSPITLLICAVIAFTAAVYGRTSELFSIITLSLALAAPLFSELAFSLPFHILLRHSRKNGGTILGYRAVRHYEDVDMVVTSDKDLFLPDKTTVNSMRVTSSSAIDEVLVAAASLINAMNSPLKKAFMNIVDNKPDLLKEVKDYDCIGSRGATGIINSRRYYIGTMDFIRSFDIDISAKVEDAAAMEKLPSLILATDIAAVAVFSINYGTDSKTAGILRRFFTQDMSLVVITDDGAINESLIKETYDIERSDVLIPTAEEKRMYRESVLPLESASAGILSTNGLFGVIAALNISRKVRDVVNTCLLLRAAGTFISLSFLLYFTVTGSMINPWQALAMQLLWAFPCFLSIFVRRLN